jgi:aspartate-semialdehyde dehydrogenase
MRIAVVGATGQVGTVMRAILRERGFPVDDIRYFGSSRSAGTVLEWNGSDVVVEDAETADFSGIEIALASSGATSSKVLSPRLAEAGAIVVDNSSAWRMDPDVPLVVAEVNPHALRSIPKGIVANPNCTTMAAMPVLMPLHRAAGLRSMTVSTYQAVSGAGREGVDELAGQLEKIPSDDVRALTFDGSAYPLDLGDKFPATIAHNVIPMAGSIVDDGSLETGEEKKLRDESRKILEIPGLLVDATCVRVPVFTGHSLSITAGFDRRFPPTRQRPCSKMRSVLKCARCQCPVWRRARTRVMSGGFVVPRRWRTASRSSSATTTCARAPRSTRCKSPKRFSRCASRRRLVQPGDARG